MNLRPTPDVGLTYSAICNSPSSSNPAPSLRLVVVATLFAVLLSCLNEILFFIMISRSLTCPICDRGGHVVCTCVCLFAYLPATNPKGNWGTLCCKVSNSKVFKQVSFVHKIQDSSLIINFNALSSSS